MAERVFAGILTVLFAGFFYFAAIDILHVVEDGHYGEIFLLLFCVIACVGWIGFLAALSLAGGAAAFQAHAEWRPIEE